LSELNGCVKQETEERIASVYVGQGDAMLEEIIEILDRQAWPSEATAVGSGGE